MSERKNECSVGHSNTNAKAIAAYTFPKRPPNITLKRHKNELIIDAALLASSLQPNLGFWLITTDMHWTCCQNHPKSGNVSKKSSTVASGQTVEAKHSKSRHPAPAHHMGHVHRISASRPYASSPWTKCEHLRLRATNSGKKPLQTSGIICTMGILCTMDILWVYYGHEYVIHMFIGFSGWRILFRPTSNSNLRCFWASGPSKSK